MPRDDTGNKMADKQEAATGRAKNRVKNASDDHKRSGSASRSTRGGSVSSTVAVDPNSSSSVEASNQSSAPVQTVDGDAKTPPTPAQASSPHTALPDEDAPCGTCNKNISTKDKAVECEVCLIWFHTKCHNVSKALYNVFCDDNNSCHWFCDHCNKGASKLYQSMAALSRQHQTLQTRVNKLADDTESTKTDLAMLSTDTDKAISALTNTTNTKIDNLETNINSAKQDYDSLQQRVKKLEETQQTPTPSNATPAVAPLTSNSSCFQTFRENLTEM